MLLLVNILIVGWGLYHPRGGDSELSETNYSSTIEYFAKYSFEQLGSN